MEKSSACILGIKSEVISTCFHRSSEIHALPHTPYWGFNSENLSSVPQWQGLDAAAVWMGRWWAGKDQLTQPFCVSTIAGLAV